RGVRGRGTAGIRLDDVYAIALVHRQVIAVEEIGFLHFGPRPVEVFLAVGPLLVIAWVALDAVLRLLAGVAGEAILREDLLAAGEEGIIGLLEVGRAPGGLRQRQRLGFLEEEFGK